MFLRPPSHHEVDPRVSGVLVPGPGHALHLLPLHHLQPGHGRHRSLQHGPADADGREPGVPHLVVGLSFSEGIMY